MAEEPLKALYFVTRNNGTMVPLLAVDELPHHIVIFNVSRVMSPFDITGMTCVERADFRHRHHNVQSAPELAARSSVTNRDALKARYFITRDSGNMVPLVAMDEMPEHFVVDGVSRAVSISDIAGMTCVGVSAVRDRFHVVEDVNNASLAYFAERTAAGYAKSDSDTASKDTEHAMRSPVSISPVMSTCTVKQLSPEVMAIRSNMLPINDIVQFSTESPQPEPSIPISVTTDGFGNIKSILSCPPSQRPSITPIIETPPSSAAQSVDIQPPSEAPSTGSLTTGVKEYCSYWIRHGECDYQQQGCLYKHEMPLDRETLGHLGLRDIPRWYREKHSLGSYLAAGGSGASFSSGSLKSAAASGKHEDDKQNKMAGNWRDAGFPPGLPLSLSPHVPRRSNVYNPRSDRSVVRPHPLPPRVRSSTPRTRLLKNNNASTEPFPNLGSLSVDSRSSSRRQSSSTIMSDIEATALREDSARKAKEDAEYAAVVAAYKEQENAASDASKAPTPTLAPVPVLASAPVPVTNPKTPEPNKGKQGSNGNRRYGKGGDGRNRGRKKVAQSTAHSVISLPPPTLP